MVSNIKKICCEVELAEAVPGLDQPMTYHLFVDKNKELVCEELSGEKLAEHFLYNLHQVSETFHKVKYYTYIHKKMLVKSDLYLPANTKRFRRKSNDQIL